ncbi:MAG: ABC transporter ATP-binding protein [Myxococcota bacterium]
MSRGGSRRPMVAVAAGRDRGRSQRERAEEALRRFHDEEDLERVYDVRMLARLWPYVRPHRRYLLGSLVMLLAMAAFGLTRPLIMRAALQDFDVQGASRLPWYGGVLAFVIAFEQVLAFPQMYWVQVAGARAMADLRGRLFRFLHHRSLSFFDTRPIGRLVTRVTNDVDAMNEMFASGALNAVGDLVRLVAIVAIMLTLNWQMSLFAFAVVPPIALLVNWTRKRMRVAFREVRARTARMNAYLNEQVSGIGVVQAYARERRSEERFDDINYAYREANTRAIVLDATLDASIEMVSSVCIAAILWYASGDMLPAGVDFATLFAFVAYIDQFFVPIRNLSARYTQIQSALAGAERVFQVHDSDGADATVAEDTPDGESPRASWPEATDDAFRFEGVTFGYKPDHPVLHDIDLVARRGETVAIVGPTGSGKSTIASLLLRLYEVGEGRLEVFGRDVRALDRTALRRAFAVVPQDVFLFPGTVASNIAAGASGVDDDKVRDALARVGALDLMERRAEGIHSPVRERGQNFSAGERQLIALARALYRDPPLLILDEPTASIDSDTETKIQGAMDAVMADRTSVIIAHRLSTIRHADRIVCLHQGRIIEQGDHDALIAKGGVYARMYRLQVARRELEQKVEALTG